MYCSTCGARVPEGRHGCDTCGAVIAARVPSLPRSAGALADRSGYPVVGVCPRCEYRGEGLPYFSRGSHAAALVGATLLTVGFMGAGGIAYYLVRRDHRVCPRCGRGWGRRGEHALVRAEPAPTGGGAPSAAGGEGMKRGWSIALFLLAAILLVGGIVGMEIVPLLLGAAAAGGGVALHRAADREREARRAALLSSLQLPVLRLAAQRGGRLTVTDVAAELGWTLPRAEKVLQSLDDGLRVDSFVTDEGVIVYEFRELLLHGPEPRRGPEPGA